MMWHKLTLSVIPPVKRQHVVLRYVSILSWLIAKGTNDVTKFKTPVVSQTNKRQFCNGCKENV